MLFFDLCMLKLRESGEVHQLPRGLLGRAQCHLLAGSTEECLKDLDEAYSIAERSGMGLWLAEAHLLRARVYQLKEPYPWTSPQDDLNKAWHFAERGPMRLHMADIHIYRARLFFREKPYPWTSPQADLAAARHLIESCGYWRRKQELEDAEKALNAANDRQR